MRSLEVYFSRHAAIHSLLLVCCLLNRYSYQFYESEESSVQLIWMNTNLSTEVDSVKGQLNRLFKFFYQTPVH